MNNKVANLYEGMKTFFYSPLDTLAPKHCLVCEKYIINRTNINLICDDCYFNIPLAPSADIIFNRLSDNFPPDELALSYAISLFRVAHDSDYMKVIHSIKYYGFSKVGYELGVEMGKVIMNNINYHYDWIVPVPIHSARLRERGFNQAEIISRGINKVINSEVNNRIIKRIKYTTTQTLLSGEERKSNVRNVFSGFSKKTKLQNDVVLLVDDVLTTGSTINECAKTLLNLGAKKVDVATLSVSG